MNDQTFLLIGREALLLMVLISAPPLLASLVAGALASVLQTVTSIQESTLSVVPKLVAAIGSLVIAAPWIGAQLTRFTTEVLSLIPAVGR